jgi:O-methyltransferase
MAISRYLFKELSKKLASKSIYLTKSLSYKQKPQSLPVNFDYVRYSTLGLCYEEIITRNIQGSVAELGVFQGNFAKRLNYLFFDRKLYLFDTFEGFDKKDIEAEKAGGFSNGTQDFSNTSVDLVLRKMPHPQNCIIKKGFFPDTATGLTDSFCFVSIDADLYEPILEGLRYFYPRLNKGGYIFVHDFNNDAYKGARQAVLQYCTENNIGFIPVPDGGGTVILTK